MKWKVTISYTDKSRDVTIYSSKDIAYSYYNRINNSSRERKDSLFIDWISIEKVGEIIEFKKKE